MDVQTRCYSLIFAVEKSIRYYRRHANFFFTTKKLLTFLSALAGTAVVASVFKSRPDLSVALGCFVAAAGTVQLVFDLDGKGRENVKALEAFTELRKVINLGADPTVDMVSEWENKRNDIEALYFAELDALNVDCHNQILESRGRNDIPRRHVHFLQRLFIHVFSWQREFPDKVSK